MTLIYPVVVVADPAGEAFSGVQHLRGQRLFDRRPLKANVIRREMAEFGLPSGGRRAQKLPHLIQMDLVADVEEEYAAERSGHERSLLIEL